MAMEDDLRRKFGQPVQQTASQAGQWTDDQITAAKQAVLGRLAGAPPQAPVPHVFTPQEQMLKDQAMAAQMNPKMQQYHQQLDQLSQNIDPEIIQRPPAAFKKIAQSIENQKPIKQADIHKALKEHMPASNKPLSEEEQKELFPEQE